jgi:hypothetical protein
MNLLAFYNLNNTSSNCCTTQSAQYWYTAMWTDYTLSVPQKTRAQFLPPPSLDRSSDSHIHLTHLAIRTVPTNTESRMKGWPRNFF